MAVDGREDGETTLTFRAQRWTEAINLTRPRRHQIHCTGEPADRPRQASEAWLSLTDRHGINQNLTGPFRGDDGVGGPARKKRPRRLHAFGDGLCRARITRASPCGQTAIRCCSRQPPGWPGAPAAACSTRWRQAEPEGVDGGRDPESQTARIAQYEMAFCRMQSFRARRSWNGTCRGSRMRRLTCHTRTRRLHPPAARSPAAAGWRGGWSSRHVRFVAHALSHRGWGAEHFNVAGPMCPTGAATWYHACYALHTALNPALVFFTAAPR